MSALFGAGMAAGVNLPNPNLASEVRKQKPAVYAGFTLNPDWQGTPVVKGPSDVFVGGTPDAGGSSSLSPSLLLRVRARDADAWRRLLRLFGPVVYGWCRRAGLQPADATDVGQEVFAAVARGLPGFRRDRPGDSFRGWLYGITQHKLADQGRRRAGQPQAEGGSDARDRLAEVAAPEDSTSGDSAAGAERGRLLRRALDLVRPEFQERTWQAFWRVTALGQSPTEVAAALGMSVNAVYIARSRVLRRLREEFGDLFP
jgi:RNA polymerase sigma-70 factor (ECF subfamily)